MRRDVFQAIADPTRRAIITLIALQAMTPNAIAENLFLSAGTIRKHVENIYAKLHVHNKLEAIQKAKNNNLI